MFEVGKSSGQRRGRLWLEYCRMHRFREYHLSQAGVYLYQDICSKTWLTRHLKVCKIGLALREQQTELDESDLGYSSVNKLSRVEQKENLYL